MRVVVTGGRDYADRETVYATLDALGVAHLAHGGAAGADDLASRWAWDRQIPAKVYLADWRQHGKQAGPMRNRLMLSEFKPNLVVAFPGGRGTAHCVRTAEQLGIPIKHIIAGNPGEVRDDPAGYVIPDDWRRT